MPDPRSKIDARYEVVTLMYRGNLDAAKVALEAYVKEGLISARDELYYSELLADALRERAGTGVQG